MESLEDKVEIIGVGCTKFGENWDQSLSDMMVDATYEAYEDAGLGPKDIEAAWFSNVGSWNFEYEGQNGCTVNDALSLSDIPVTKVFGMCATGMEALRNACFGVASGQYDIVLVTGAEKFSDVDINKTGIRMAYDYYHPYFIKGHTAISFFAFLAIRYMHQYGLKLETLAKISVKSHHAGTLNPKSWLQNEITVEQVMNSPMIAYPLTLLHCAQFTDGAASAIIVKKGLVRNAKNRRVSLKALQMVSSSCALVPNDERWDMTSFPLTQVTAQRAYRQAGIKDPKMIDFAEVHDCFSIAELVHYEDLGFCKKGEGGRLVEEGVTAIDGSLPVCPSGGLKCFGHPMGATGLRMLYEVVKQLRGQAGLHQLKKADLGLIHNLGGLAELDAVAILAGG